MTSSECEKARTVKVSDLDSGPIADNSCIIVSTLAKAKQKSLFSKCNSLVYKERRTGMSFVPLVSA